MPNQIRRRRRLPLASNLTLHISPFPLDQPVSDQRSERSCLTDVGLGHLARGCRGLEKLSLVWCSAISSTGLVRIAENCKKLTSLDLQVIPYCLFCAFELHISFWFSTLETWSISSVNKRLIFIVEYPCNVVCAIKQYISGKSLIEVFAPGEAVNIVFPYI